MKQIAICVVAALALGLGSLVVAEEKKSDDAQLIQGRWKLIKGVRNGKEREEKAEVVITADQMTVERAGDDKKESINYRLDSSKSPKQFDLIQKRDTQEKVMPGIYELQGDSLKLCYGRRSDSGRPTEFESKDGDGRALMILQRVKEEKK